MKGATILKIKYDEFEKAVKTFGLIGLENRDDIKKRYLKLSKKFHPDIVLVSAGYDLMRDEEISRAKISFAGLGAMVQKIVDTYHDKPIAFVLEGGYNLESLLQSVEITLDILNESASV